MALGLVLTILLIALVGVGATAQGPPPDPGRVIRAAHILVSPYDDPSGALSLDAAHPAWVSARAEAAVIAAELRALEDRTERAARFATLARERSDDTVSGMNGGDLGPFTREAMVPEFADPLFDGVGLEPGDILGPVRSDFGWHVILYQGEGPDPAATPRPEPTVTPAATPSLTLGDPGAEPRSVLRMAPTAGTAATMTFTTIDESSITIEGLAPMTTHSAATMTWDAHVTDVTAAGATRIELTLTDVHVDGYEGLGEAEYRELMAGMVGLSGWTTSDPSGQVVDSGAELPEGLDPVLGRAFEQVVSAFSLAPATFPDRPVGVGATWTSVTPGPPTDLATASVSTAVTTITAIDGSLVTLTMQARSVSEMGPVTLPGLPDGTEVVVLSGESNGGGTTTMDLASLSVTATVRSGSTSRMVIWLDGQEFPMESVTKSEMRIRSE